MCNMIPDEVIGNLADVHIYKNHQEGFKEQLTRNVCKLCTLDDNPYLNYRGNIDNFLDSATPNSFTVLDYQSHPKINYPLSN